MIRGCNDDKTEALLDDELSRSGEMFNINDIQVRAGSN